MLTVTKTAMLYSRRGWGGYVLFSLLCVMATTITTQVNIDCPLSRDTAHMGVAGLCKQCCWDYVNNTYLWQNKKFQHVFLKHTKKRYFLYFTIPTQVPSVNIL